MDWKNLDTNNLPGESFLPVTCFEGCYEISDLGRLRCLPKQAGFMNRSVSMFKQKLNRTGYCTVVLYTNGKAKHITTHRLVAMAFLPNNSGKIEVNHKDSNRQNNKVDNLEWATRLENECHARAAGLKKHFKGETHPCSKLTDIQRNEIRGLYSTGKYKQVELASKFGITQAHVSKIILT